MQWRRGGQWLRHLRQLRMVHWMLHGGQVLLLLLHGVLMLFGC